MSENKNAKTSADGPEYERGFVDGMQRQMQLHVNRVIKAEPTAWISDSPTKGNGKQLHWTKSEAWRWSSNITPLYTAPPKRELVCVCGAVWEGEEMVHAPRKRKWVGLTDEEVSEIIDREIGFNSCWGPEETFARAIEAKLREKNT